MEKYYTFADYYRYEARQTIDKIGTHLEPRYRLSLEVIYSLYLQIFERIDVANGRFTTEELNPSPEEVQDRIDALQVRIALVEPWGDFKLPSRDDLARGL